MDSSERVSPENRLPLALGITGASGAPYWVRFVEVALRAGIDLHVAASGNVDTVCRTEVGHDFEACIERARSRASDAGDTVGTATVFDRRDFYCPMASGSARYAGMVILPCSMGTMARIASGTSDDLITRAADVSLKERRKLILVPRETPLNLVHLRTMTTVTEAGAVVPPAMPGFYHRPESIDDLVDFVVQRIADQLDLGIELTRRWGGR